MVNLISGRSSLAMSPLLVLSTVIVLHASGVFGDAVPEKGWTIDSSPSGCFVGPEYYRIDLVPTRRVPGTYASTGEVEVQFARSPFGISLSAAGEYVYDVQFALKNIQRPKSGQYVAWISTPNLDSIVHLGPLDDKFTAHGQVSYNKFLVIVSLEADGYSSDRWSGPIVLRGLSRSGLMHTSMGHGLFESEPCTQYGFN